MNLPIKPVFVKFLLIGLIGLGAGYGVSITVFPFSSKPKQKIAPQPLAESVETAKTDKTKFIGQISVQFNSESAQIGQPVEAEISIDTKDAVINGFDAILQFDPLVWETASLQFETPEDSDFAIYPVNEVDGLKGEARLSGLTSPEAGFTGDVVVGTLSLTPKKSGELDLKVLFEGMGKGNDSNLAQTQTSKDILGKVIDGKVIVD